MMGDDYRTPDSWGTRLRRSVPFDRRDALWLPLAMLPAVVAVLVYWVTNPFPAYGAGLYTKIATEIAAGGYLPPETVPGYTVDGVPFAYPPLQFYVLAVLLDLGVDPFVLSRFLPGIVVVLAQVPLYVLARDVSGSRPAGAVAGAVVAATPEAIQWHVSAGGLVRAFALLYALTAIYAGYHVFRRRRRTPVVVGTLTFGMTVLTHPTYSLFVVVTYVLMWAVTDRSVDGFLRAATVGLGGLAISAPWLVWIHLTHGITTLTAAAGTHGGIGGGLVALLVERPTHAYLAFGVVLALLYRRYRFLPAWIGAVTLVFAQPRFASVAAAVGVSALLSSWIDDRASLGMRSRAIGPLVVAAALVLAAVGGGAYYAHTMTQDVDAMTPSFVDEDDVAAMEWVAAETDRDATFLVLGDVAEEFPAHTDRVIVVGPWGVEWVTPAAYDRHLEGFESVSECYSVECAETVAHAVGEPPNYVYVPKGQYTIRGENAVQFGTLERSFEHSGEYERVYENDGVAIYRSLDR
ncbi:MAG: 6-pyruvoyl-tetrahydropterin synthase-related protein [Halanaeroarchaeum sp.]